MDETTTWTTSVCTGALLMAAAGLLDGRPATTHWLARETLAGLGANPVPDRVVFDGKYVTGAGVSAGIDMALTLVTEIYGPEIAQAVQLGIEYDLQPPHDAGKPERPHRRSWTWSRLFHGGRNRLSDTRRVTLPPPVWEPRRQGNN